MKDFRDIQDKLLDTDELMKRGSAAILNSMGKITALVAAVITLAATFTDISFLWIFSEDFASSLLLILTSGYIIYFSLEDAGERSGETTEEYRAAKARYDKERARICGEDIEALREYCREYALAECIARQNAALLSWGLSREMLDAYKSGKETDKKYRHRLARIAKIKPAELTPKILLSRDRGRERCELENPERHKLPTLIMKLIPSTLCTFVTVSVILSTKEGLSGADVLSALLRLSALPMLGFRGYSEGYTYTKHSMSLWLETKANIIEGFAATKGG